MMYSKKCTMTKAKILVNNTEQKLIMIKNKFHTKNIKVMFITMQFLYMESFFVFTRDFVKNIQIN